MAPRQSRLLRKESCNNTLTFLVAIALILTVGAQTVIGGPTAHAKLKKAAELFDYVIAGDIPSFQAGFSNDATYKYSGGPGLPFTGPFQGQDSTVKALEIYSTLFNFTLRSYDLAVSPTSGKVISRVDVGLAALITGARVDEECFLYITFNDDLFITEISESCNSLAKFTALQTKSCAKKIAECAKKHDEKDRS